jgi:tRNA nucleotidyltransferase (CCA-adding enzyme)
MADYIYTMESRLSPDQFRTVNTVQQIARTHGMNVYLTGGAIRDILTGFPIRDLDFTVQGNPLVFEKDLESAGGIVDMVDKTFSVLHVVFQGIRAEIGMARAEVFDKPGKPPMVTPATINDDLRRRDFTFNAMALSLNNGSRGLLLDPFNGAADIEAKLIRILHSYSFLEDPSRLIRATRFATRFGFEMEERTRTRYDSAREGEYIQYLGTRAIGYEIEQIAHEENPIAVMQALEGEGWLKVLCSKWTVAKADDPELAKLLKTRATMADFNISVDAAPAIMHFLTLKLGHEEVASIQQLIPHREFVNSWKRLENDAKELSKKLLSKEAALNSGAWQILTSAKPEALLYLDVTGRNKTVEEKVKNFFGKWRQVQEKIPVAEMATLRITPQLPEYPKIAQEAFLLLLDGKLRSEGEIMKFLAPYEPPPPPPPPTPVRRGRAAAKKAAAAAAKAPSQSEAIAAPEAAEVVTKTVVEKHPAVTAKAAAGSKQPAQKKTVPEKKPEKASTAKAKPVVAKNAARPAPKKVAKVAKAPAKAPAKATSKKKAVARAKAVAPAKKTTKPTVKMVKNSKAVAKSAKPAAKPSHKAVQKKTASVAPAKSKHGQKSGKPDKKHPKRR